MFVDAEIILKIILPLNKILLVFWKGYQISPTSYLYQKFDPFYICFCMLTLWKNQNEKQ